MNFSDVVSYAYIMFFYVLPALLILLVSYWIKDMIVRVAKRWKRSAEKRLELMKEDRWYVILELMKVIMFIVLLFPLLAVANYATNENASDPAPEIFTDTMPYVFIVIVLWYLLAIVIYGLYQKNKDDIEKEKERRAFQEVVE